MERLTPTQSASPRSSLLPNQPMSKPFEYRDMKAIADEAVAEAIRNPDVYADTPIEFRSAMLAMCYLRDNGYLKSDPPTPNE